MLCSDSFWPLGGGGEDGGDGCGGGVDPDDMGDGNKLVCFFVDFFLLWQSLWRSSSLKVAKYML